MVGDLHGRFNTLMQLLDTADYARDKDILLSVGDLIDRGPRSVEVVNFFNEPDRYVIRGNHEQMVLNLEDWLEVWNYPPNGGPATCRSLHASSLDIAWLMDSIIDFPICLDIGNDNDPHGIRLVHAEQPFDWSEEMFRDFLQNSDNLDAGESRLLWGRENIEAVLAGVTPWRHPQRSGRRSFCGHTPILQITQAHDTHWIDTFDAGTLSCIDAMTLESWSVPVHDDEYPG